MQTREEVIAFCTKLEGAYEDYPFHDPNWTTMRHHSNQKVFAWIFEKDGLMWINVKCDPEWRDMWRATYPSVLPGYHLNKKYWNSIILDNTVPVHEIKRMIEESYDLTRKRKKKAKN